MNRRQFLSAGAAGIFSASNYAAPFADMKPKRVGMIGSGWYGKSDLLRLVQVAPVEVVSLCDVDSHMLAEAAELGVPMAITAMIADHEAHLTDAGFGAEDLSNLARIPRGTA